MFASNFATQGGVWLESGGDEDSCKKNGGQWFSGTVDPKSLTFNRESNTLGLTYANEFADSIGTGLIQLPGKADVPLGWMAEGIFRGRRNEQLWTNTQTVVNASAAATGALMALPIAAEATLGSQLTTLGSSAQELVLVSRWGRSGLQAGDWVMKGGVNWRNYLLSGKWQPGLGNQFARFSSGAEYWVPRTTVRIPWTKEQGLGVIKSLLGQRIFIP